MLIKIGVLPPSQNIGAVLTLATGTLSVFQISHYQKHNFVLFLTKKTILMVKLRIKMECHSLYAHFFISTQPNKHMEGFLYFDQHMKPFFILLSTCLKILKNICTQHPAICQKYRAKIKKLGLRTLCHLPKYIEINQNLSENDIFCDSICWGLNTKKESDFGLKIIFSFSEQSNQKLGNIKLSTWKASRFFLSTWRILKEIFEKVIFPILNPQKRF